MEEREATVQRPERDWRKRMKHQLTNVRDWRGIKLQFLYKKATAEERSNMSTVRKRLEENEAPIRHPGRDLTTCEMYKSETKLT